MIDPFSRTELIRAWSDGVSSTTDQSTPAEGIDAFLRDLLDRLIDALGQAEFSSQPAMEVGSRLVARGFTGAQSLGHTVEILAHALPGQHELRTVEGLSGKVAALLGALASGYTAALRRRVVEQDEARFWAVFDSAPVGMVISRLDGTITQTNGALTEMLHYSPAELAVREISELFHPDDAALLQAAYQALRDGTRERFHNRVKLLAVNGDTTWVGLTVTVLRDVAGSRTHHVTMVEDFTDRQLLEQRVRHQSLHDLLTGLPNRLHFAIHLEALLERERSAAVTLYKIDFDGFSIDARPGRLTQRS